MKVIQFVGYKGSGKTTLVQQTISYCSHKGLQIGSLKHHGHGGFPIGFENTDSEKHKKAGALVAGVEGNGLFQLSLPSDWEMENMLSVYRQLKIDVVVMEGFKQQGYQKIVLLRSKDDLSLINQVSNVVAVFSSLPIETEIPYPIFSDYPTFCEWFYEHVMENG